MKSALSRRQWLKLGVVGGTGALVFGSVPRATGRRGKEITRFCVALCNHWSYIGIGWQLGIESNVLSVTDAMETADRLPHVKTCINLDARAFELLAEKFPEVAQRLKRYLAEGKVELIGGTYGQPMGTTISGESNIRQLVVGRETIRKALGYEMVTFLEEEEFTHPQVPQIARGAGYRYASLAQLDTWGRAGIPLLEHNVIAWKGIDGTTISCIPKNSLFGASLDPKQLVDSPAFKKLETQGVPLVFVWAEFGWEDPEHPAYLTESDKYKALAEAYPVAFVTLKEYLDKFGAEAKETILLPMDAWSKSLTWGLGGDQVRILARKVESLLLAAELFDAIAAGLGGKAQVETLEKGWKDLLASQSHDVGLCEYSRWQGDRMAPMDRLEDLHAFPWGVMGYHHLDSARQQGEAALEAALGALGRRINSRAKAQGQLSAIVFNPHCWERTDTVSTGRLYPLPEGTRAVLVKDRAGRVLPAQVVKTEKDQDGNLIVAEMAFLAPKVPSAGYETCYLQPTKEAQPAAATDLVIDESRLILENEFLRVQLDPATGAVSHLLHKALGREVLAPQNASFPHFTGRPNPNLSLHPAPPAQYDSATSKADLDWLAKGPVLATVRARHRWKYLNFETQVTLAAGRPYVEVVSRVLARVPPHSDASPPDIKEGYRLSFTPGFKPVTVLRDYPLAIEPTRHDAFHALSFVDLLGEDLGLLVLHSGTQWFRRNESGVFSNLIMREWESHFTQEYGWPLYAEYRHALRPHALNMRNAERLQEATAFTQPLLCRVGPLRQGDLPPSRSFLALTPGSVMLSAFRRKRGLASELRVIEVQGEEAQATVRLETPFAHVAETDLLGKKVGMVVHSGKQLGFKIQPWKIKTFELQGGTV